MRSDIERMKLSEFIKNVNIKNFNQKFIKSLEDSGKNSSMIKKNKYLNVLNMSKLLKDLIFMSFMQTIFLGIIIFTMERFNLLFLYVTTFGNIIYITELALTFFFLFLFIDVITEGILIFFRNKLLKESKDDEISNYVLFFIFIEAFLQTMIFIVINAILHSIGLFGVYIRNNSGENVSIEFFYFLVFIAIFFVEYFFEGLKIISNKLNQKLNIIQ